MRVIDSLSWQTWSSMQNSTYVYTGSLEGASKPHYTLSLLFRCSPYTESHSKPFTCMISIKPYIPLNPLHMISIKPYSKLWDLPAKDPLSYTRGNIHPKLRVVCTENYTTYLIVWILNQIIQVKSQTQIFSKYYLLLLRFLLSPPPP